MESILSGGQDFLLPGLSYDLSGAQASYVISRRQSQINSNVPTAGPNDVRQVTFNVADHQDFRIFRHCAFNGRLRTQTLLHRCSHSVRSPIAAGPG